jgi:hypothetical protein
MLKSVSDETVKRNIKKIDTLLMVAFTIMIVTMSTTTIMFLAISSYRNMTDYSYFAADLVVALTSISAMHVASAVTAHTTKTKCMKLHVLFGILYALFVVWVVLYYTVPLSDPQLYWSLGSLGLSMASGMTYGATTKTVNNIAMPLVVSSTIIAVITYTINSTVAAYAMHLMSRISILALCYSGLSKTMVPIIKQVERHVLFKTE